VATVAEAPDPFGQRAKVAEWNRRKAERDAAADVAARSNVTPIAEEDLPPGFKYSEIAGGEVVPSSFVAPLDIGPNIGPVDDTNVMVAPPGTPMPREAPHGPDAQLASIVKGDRAQAAQDEDATIRRNLGGVSAGAAGAGDYAATAGIGSALHGAKGDQILSMLLAGKYSPGRPNPKKPILQRTRNEFLGGVPTGEVDEEGNPILSVGLLGEEKAAQEALVKAQVQEQAAYAEHYGAETGRLEARAAQMELQARKQAERRAEALEASKLVMTKVSDAADRMNEAPDIDPNRYWKNISNGKKAAWAIVAGLGGLSGLGPNNALMSAIGRDIEAQKATFAQKQAGMAARMDELGASRSVYQDLREAIGDEQIAEQATELAYLERAKSHAMKIAAEQGMNTTAMQGNVFLAQLDQKMAEIRQSIDLTLASTPSRIGGGWKPLVRGPNRKLLEGELKYNRERQGKTEDLAIETGAKAAEARVDRDLKREEIVAKREENAVKRESSATDREVKFTEKAGPALGAVNYMDDFLAKYEKKDVPGAGDVFVYGGSEQDARAEAQQIKQALGRMWSQGVITDEELEEFEDMLSASTLFGGGSDRLKKNVEIIRDAVYRTKVEPFERFLNEEQREGYYRGRVGKLKARRSGTAPITESASDDAKALGGKVITAGQ
jgi:hypothetical protein